MLKLNVDCAPIGKPSPNSIGGIFQCDKGQELLFFCKLIGEKNSSEAGIWMVPKALRKWEFYLSFRSSLIVKSDLANAISWVTSRQRDPWKFQLPLNEIKPLVSARWVEFQHINKSTNNVTDSLAKQEVHLVPSCEPLCFLFCLGKVLYSYTLPYAFFSPFACRPSSIITSGSYQKYISFLWKISYQLHIKTTGKKQSAHQTRLQEFAL